MAQSGSRTVVDRPPPSGFGGSGGPTGVPPDQFLRMLIERSCRAFEKRTGRIVTKDAEIALFRPAQPHASAVMRELALGKVTVKLLIGHIESILDNAIQFSAQDVGRGAVLKSMKLNCPYLGWC